MILSNFLIRFNCIEKILNPFRKIWAAILGLSPYGAYAYLLGLLCGYPMGAKLTADLYSQKFISKKEAGVPAYIRKQCKSHVHLYLCGSRMYRT